MQSINCFSIKMLYDIKSGIMQPVLFDIRTGIKAIYDTLLVYGKQL